MSLQRTRYYPYTISANELNDYDVKFIDYPAANFVVGHTMDLPAIAARNLRAQIIRDIENGEVVPVPASCTTDAELLALEDNYVLLDSNDTFLLSTLLGRRDVYPNKNTLLDGLFNSKSLLDKFVSDCKGTFMTIDCVYANGEKCYQNNHVTDTYGMAKAIYTIALPVYQCRGAIHVFYKVNEQHHFPKHLYTKYFEDIIQKLLLSEIPTTLQISNACLLNIGFAPEGGKSEYWL